ncbi:AAA family ATPase [Candidatus Methanomethylophilus sp. 1R26]|uniref:AAA family ATPase n=1 Tax=Candidatus Methanomethylophilus sp. 1R26 TaxID=1769296 RepID=UPI0009EC20E8|nr:AAA family ATPase [Candidatus Methanomethylophilus sp. 1R26]
MFLDEVRNVSGWADAVEALRLSGADIYVTGSDAHMLSADLAGRLSGRAVEIRVRPLVFREYLEFRRAYCPGEDESGMLNDFIRWGGMPFIAAHMGNRKGLPDILSGICNTVYVKDIIERNKIRNPLAL